MLFHDLRGLAGGILLILIGLGFAIYAYANYNLGSFAQMGPGMMPFVLGIILVALGAIISAIGWFSIGTYEVPDFRSLTAVTAAIIGFALVSNFFGMVPAVIALTVASGLADRKLTPRALAAMTAVLVVMAVGVFYFGLGIRMPLFAWPF